MGSWSNLTLLLSYTLGRIDILPEGAEVSPMSYWPDTGKL
jgi:hypothetical protein